MRGRAVTGGPGAGLDLEPAAPGPEPGDPADRRRALATRRALQRMLDDDDAVRAAARVISGLLTDPG